ncbi:hypothetical protein [Streptomyces sp. NPDC002990]
MTEASRPISAAEAARAALEEVTDPGQRAMTLALLAVGDQLWAAAESVRSIDGRLEQVNAYLGALANKP